MSGMSRLDRAKQFAPFAALKGFEEAVKLSELESFQEIILGEDAQAELNQRLLELERGDRVCAVYYCNGQYLRLTGEITKIDAARRRIQIDDTKVPIDRLLSI